MSAKEASFGATGLDPRLIRALNKRRFTEPTPVQAETIPRALEGKDVVARARTGSGKTLAYILPVLHRILTSGSDSSSWRALVLVPTRELCEQVKEEAVSVAVHCGGAITVTALGADLPEAARRAAFASAGSLVVATPARIAAALRDGCLPAVALQDTLQCLVLDEADLLLSYGYEDDISALAPHIPRGCQCLLMSATNSQDVQRLQKLVLHNPTVLDLVRLPAGRDAGRQEGPTEHIQQFQYFCATADERFLCAMALLKLSLVRKKVLLFVNTVDTAFRLRLFLEAFGVRSAVLDAALPLASRHNILQQFNKGLFDHLIATDSTHAAHHDAQGGEPPAVPSSSAPAARAGAGRQGGGKGPRGGRGGERDGEFGVTRGIDFKGVRTVVNVDLPGSRCKQFCWLTAWQGMAITLATPHTLPQLERLQRDLAQQQRTPTATEDENDEDEQDGERDSEEPQGVPTMPSFDRLKREALQALRYRGEDALRALTKSVVKEARLKDLKLEILNSQRLQEHFEEKPHELALLKHDKSLHQVQRHAHLKHLPAYVRASTNKGAGTSSTGGSTKLRFAAGRKPKRKRSDAGGDPIKGKGFVRKRVVEDDTLTEIEEAALQKAKQDEKAARKHERLLTKAAAQASKGNVRKHRSRKR